MVIKVLNLNKCLKKFEDLGKIDYLPVISQATVQVKNDARGYAPVDTGYLKRSISGKVYQKKDNPTGVVSTNVEYAPYQEFGTSKMKAQPFMKPAYNANKGWIMRAMEKYFKLKAQEISNK